jgi:hypothetical protein
VFVTRFQAMETTGFAKERIVTEIALQARLRVRALPRSAPSTSARG